MRWKNPVFPGLLAEGSRGVRALAGCRRTLLFFNTALTGIFLGSASSLMSLASTVEAAVAATGGADDQRRASRVVAPAANSTTVVESAAAIAQFRLARERGGAGSASGSGDCRCSYSRASASRRA